MRYLEPVGVGAVELRVVFIIYLDGRLVVQAPLCHLRLLLPPLRVALLPPAAQTVSQVSTEGQKQ